MKSSPIASARHTWILLGILAAVAGLGAMSAARGGGPAATGGGANHAGLYLGLIASEWLLFRYAWMGLKRAGTPPRTLFGRGSAWTAVLLGACGWAVASGVALALRRGLAAAGLPVLADAARTAAAVHPHGAPELALWALLSVSAGICEEFVFRGYLLRQLSAWLGGPVRGLFASSLVFGLAHAYQGLAPVVLITGIGLVFGGLALLTRRLAPPMVAHALMDLVAGLTP